MQNYRKLDVYPGHPCIIAMQIVETFNTYEAATKITERGWPQALSSGVSGTGGAVYQAIEVLKMMDQGSSSEDAYKAGCAMWKASREAGDFAENLKAGEAAAKKIKTDFIKKTSSWFVKKPEYKIVHAIPVKMSNQGMLFKIEDLQYEIQGENLLIEDLLRENYYIAESVNRNFSEFDLDEEYNGSVHDKVAALFNAAKTRKNLLNERSETWNRDRYKELDSFLGPIRAVEREIKLREVEICMILKQKTGLDPDKYRLDL